jgi:hypothetical protein
MRNADVSLLRRADDWDGWPCVYHSGRRAPEGLLRPSSDPVVLSPRVAAWTAGRYSQPPHRLWPERRLRRIGRDRFVAVVGLEMRLHADVLSPHPLTSALERPRLGLHARVGSRCTGCAARGPVDAGPVRAGRVMSGSARPTRRSSSRPLSRLDGRIPSRTAYARLREGIKGSPGIRVAAHS